MENLSFSSLTLGFILLFQISAQQAASAKSGRCVGEITSLQTEIRNLQESQEMLHGEIADLKNTFSPLNDVVTSILPEDCSAAKARGSWSTRAWISPPGLPARKARCEQKEQGGGWTIILARRPTKHPLDFNATWQQYKQGFGDINQGEFWIGNEVLHALTDEVPHQLRVVLTDWEGLTTHATWSFFYVASEDQHYKLGIRGYHSNSTASNALQHHNGHPFSTHDVDNDNDLVHCAEQHGGGWWYFRCYMANPTGAILHPHHEDGDHGMIWLVGLRKVHLKSIVMMIRPSAPASYSSYFK